MFGQADTLKCPRCSLVLALNCCIRTKRGAERTTENRSIKAGLLAQDSCQTLISRSMLKATCLSHKGTGGQRRADIYTCSVMTTDCVGFDHPRALDPSP